MITNPIRCDYLRSGANPLPVLDLDATKNYLKIDAGQTTDDALILELIATAAFVFEAFTGVDLLTHTYVAHCTGFPAFKECQVALGVTEFNCIQLKKAPLQGEPTVTYLKDGVFISWPSSEFELIFDTRSSYSAIFAKKKWPITDRHPRPVHITLAAGYGDTFADVPVPIRIGLLQHIALMYENRGDCSGKQTALGSGFAMRSLPSTSRLAYAPYIIYSLSNSWNC